MNDLEICIAILSYCGWDFDPPETRTWKSRDRWCKSPAGEMVIVMGMEFPRPNNDLNAMYEVVKTLETGFDGSQADDYQQTLWSIVNPGVQWEQPEDEPQPLYDVGYLQNMIEATARQRAEAFIKTVCPEKWKGNE